MVPHLGGIFSEVKSLRSRAQGPKISRFAPGPGPKGPKKNKINKQIENNKAPPAAAPPKGGAQARPPWVFVVLNLFDDFVFLWTLWALALERSDLSLGLGAKRLNFGKYAPEVGDHFLLLKVSENTL